MMSQKQQFSPQDYPTRPGVYLMKEADGIILYVGKARNLRARLRSYLRPEQDSRPQIRFLMERTASIETIVTDTEKEALILENTLIKAHRPRYNIDLRDDKTYVSLRIDLREPYPGLRIVRQVTADGALYFGPFSSSTAVKETLKQLYRIFPLRRLSAEHCARRQRPCLYFQIGQCSAPCHGKISSEDYAELVRGAIALLSGREDDVLKLLQGQMREAAKAMRFEEAALLRDRIAAIQATVERQKVVEHGGGDCDVFGLWGDGRESAIVVLIIRRGRLIDRRSYRLYSVMEDPELLGLALQQFYDHSNTPPPLILLPSSCASSEVLSEWLGEKSGTRVRLIVPQRGDKRELVELARQNAREHFGEKGTQEIAVAILQEIVIRLGLHKLPARMECFDISNMQGGSIVGSMVVFIDGLPAKEAYRRYELKTLDGHADDYAALNEVLGRRLDRAQQEGIFPDLILVDGGRGQLGILSELIAGKGLAAPIEIASIAKARREKVAGNATLRSQERFFRPGNQTPILFPPGSAALRMLQRLRDEAHRFAITYHRQKRKAGLLASQLEQIPGVGPKLRIELLRHFGSLRQLRAATMEELSAAPGVGNKTARRIYEGLHPAANNAIGDTHI
jgi:excinuclease ABC subunit C